MQTLAEISLENALYARDLTRQAMEKGGISCVNIAKELKLIAFSDIQDYLTVDEGGAVQVLPLADLKKKKSRVIKKIREKTVITESKDGERLFKTSSVEFELYDKLSALRTCADILGMVVEKHEHTGKDGGPIRVTDLSDDELLDIIGRERSARATQETPSKG